MSGQVIFLVRAGKSTDPRYDRYAEWYLKVIGEDGVETTISPTYDELSALFHQIFVHEFTNDWMRGRDPDFTKKRLKFDLPSLWNNAQTDFENHWRDPERIPLIYHQCNYPRVLGEDYILESLI